MFSLKHCQSTTSESPNFALIQQSNTFYHTGHHIILVVIIKHTTLYNIKLTTFFPITSLANVIVPDKKCPTGTPLLILKLIEHKMIIHKKVLHSSE